MKRIATALAAIAIIITMALSTAACGGNGDKADNDTLSRAGAQQGEPFESAINIRYVDMDTLMAHYKLAKEINEQGQKLMVGYQAQERQKSNELNNYQRQIENKAQSQGYLSQASYESDIQTLQNRANAAQQHLANEQNRISTILGQQQQRLLDSINSYIVVYNAEKKYDAILLREAGLYFNPQLDITAEILAGLNARYKGDSVFGDEDKKDEAPATETKQEKKK